MRELIIRWKIDRVEDDVVRRAERAIGEPATIATQLEEKQLRNVSAVAAQTETLAVVENFIRYQIGRAKRGQGWRAGPDDGFGQRLLSDLAWVRKQARGLADTEVPTNALEIRLARLYLGYLTRHFKYVNYVNSLASAPGGQPDEPAGG